MPHPRVTVVVPTYKEVDSLPHLIDRIAKVRQESQIEIDLVIMDDDSRDGSVELIAARPEPWIELNVRTADRGLSAAVLDGLRRAKGDIVVCMDADLSHPPEALPALLRKLDEGADFVIGSRYVDGGSTSDDWGFLRWLNSRVATLLARPLVSARDPMAGYFALRRSTFEKGHDFNPVGYKIALELIVKCGCERVVEVPIHFEDRRFGESKLTLKQQLLYLQHLRRLYLFKFGVWSPLAQFVVVGGAGTLVNIALVTMLGRGGWPPTRAVAAGIAAALLIKFALNRVFRRGSRPRAGASQAWPERLARFLAASALGTTVNYLTAVWILRAHPSTRPPSAAVAGVAAGAGINLLASRYIAFRTRHLRPALLPPSDRAPPH